MAEYNVDIQVRAKAKQAERELERVKRKLDDLSKGAAKIDFSAPERAIRNLGRTARNVGNEIKNIFGRGLFAGAVMGASQLPGAFQAATAKLGPLQGAITGVGNAFDSALGGVPHLVGEILGAVGQLPNSFGIAAVAAMAFAPQLLKASSAAVGLGDAVDKAVGKQVTEAIADAGSKVAGLNAQVNATKASFADLIKGSTLNQLNAQLSDARHEMGEYHSSTKQAVVAAEQLAAVLKEQKAEQQAITNLARQAQGLPTASEDRRAMNKFRRVQNRKEFERQNKLQLEGVQNALKEMEIKDSILENERLNIKAQEVQNRLDKQAIASNTQKVQSLRRQAEIQERISKRKSADIVREQAASRAAFLRGDPNAFPGGVQNPSEQGFRIARIRKEGEERLAALRRFSQLEREIDAARDKRALNSYNTRRRRQKFLAEQEKKASRTRGQRGESVALGVGFPLLFGGGPGAVLGGALGSFAGPGFGGQILLSALGQQFDALTQKTAQLGQALLPATADIEALITALGDASSQSAKYIKELEELFGSKAALAEATQQMSRLVGDEGVQALKDFGAQAKQFGGELSRLGTQIQAALAGGILATGIPAAVTGEMERTRLRRQSIVSNDPQIMALRAQQELVNPNGFFGGNVQQYNELDKQILDRQREINAAKERGAEIDRIKLEYQSDIVQGAKESLAVAEISLQIAELGGDIEDEKVYALMRQRVELKAITEQQEILKEFRKEDADFMLITTKLAGLQVKYKTELANLENQLNRKRDKKGTSKRESQVPFLENEIELKQLQAIFDEKSAKAGFEGNKIAQVRLKQAVALLGIRKKEADIDASTKIPGDEKKLMLASLQYDKAKLRLEAEYAIAQLEKDANTRRETAIGSVQSEINMLQEKIQGREREYQIQREIDRLITEGVEPQKAKDLVETKYELLAVDKERIRQQELLNNLVNTSGQQFTNLLETLITGTNDWNSALRNVLSSLSSALLRYGLNALGGDDGVGLFSILAGTFDGGRAKGGPVTSGRSYMVGERGPELFMPNASGTIVPNNALGGGVGNITVNVEAGGTSVQGDQPNANKLGQALGAAVRAELVKQKRPGGLLA